MLHRGELCFICVVHLCSLLLSSGLGEQRQPLSLSAERTGTSHPAHYSVAQTGAQVSYRGLKSSYVRLKLEPESSTNVSCPVTLVWYMQLLVKQSGQRNEAAH